jgi:hypothetical protein
VSIVEVILIIFVSTMVILPLLGVTAWAALASINVTRRLLQAPARAQLQAEPDRPALDVEEEVESLQREIRRLKEVDEFHRALFLADSEAETRPGAPS